MYEEFPAALPIEKLQISVPHASLDASRPICTPPPLVEDPVVFAFTPDTWKQPAGVLVPTPSALMVTGWLNVARLLWSTKTCWEVVLGIAPFGQIAKLSCVG